MLKRFKSSKLFITFSVLFFILLFNFILGLIMNGDVGFFKIEIREGHLYGQLIDILNRSVPVMILAMGMTLVIATSGTDLSVGATMAICGSVAIKLIRGSTTVVNDETALALALILIIVIILGILCGLWNGFLVAKMKMQPVVATLILMVAGRGAAQLILDGRTLTTKYAPFSIFGQGWFLGFPVACFIALGVFILLWLITRRTAFGLFVESVGINQSAANHAGIRPVLILLAIYGISGFCSAISGILYVSNIMIADANNIGLNYELDAILAVVLGGTSMTGGKFYLGGSCIGAIILMALTKSIYAFNVAPEFALVVKSAVVIGIVLIQSPVTQKYFSSHMSKNKKGAAANE